MTGVSIHGTGMTTDDVIRKAHDTLPVATSSAAGVVKIGSGVSVTGDGTISVAGGDVGTEFTVADNGQFVINGLSTNDPSVENAIWSDNGVLVQSGHTAPSGGGSPQPGQPTRFLTLTYHHPGNEDGSSESATTGIAIPDSAIAEGTAYSCTWQVKVVCSGQPNEMFFTQNGNQPLGGMVLYSRLPGTNTDAGNPIFQTAGPQTSTTLFQDDGQFDLNLITTGTNTLAAKLHGLSTADSTDWTINVQLTPIAP